VGLELRLGQRRSSVHRRPGLERRATAVGPTRSHGERDTASGRWCGRRDPYYHPVVGDAGGTSSDYWRSVLTGEDPSLQRWRRVWRRVPSPPRCKVCSAPFLGPGGAAARALGFGPSTDSSILCRKCFGKLAKSPGGAELELSILFADVQGSTAIAEQMSASAFAALLQEYYRLAAAAVDRNGGVVDKFLGDGVMALFIPVITGENHAARAVAAGQAVLAAVEELSARGLVVGAGVHAGPAYVGLIGSDHRSDFTAVGDTVNVAARLGAQAGPGELLVSRAAWDRAGLGRPIHEREVEIAGRSVPLAVVSLTDPQAVAAPPA
jgi:adenylate cyclase